MGVFCSCRLNFDHNSYICAYINGSVSREFTLDGFPSPLMYVAVGVCDAALLFGTDKFVAGYWGIRVFTCWVRNTYWLRTYFVKNCHYNIYQISVSYHHFLLYLWCLNVLQEEEKSNSSEPLRLLSVLKEFKEINSSQRKKEHILCTLIPIISSVCRLW